jgi:hypothetical protein
MHPYDAVLHIASMYYCRDLHLKCLQTVGVAGATPPPHGSLATPYLSLVCLSHLMSSDLRTTQRSVYIILNTLQSVHDRSVLHVPEHPSPL